MSAESAVSSSAVLPGSIGQIAVNAHDLDRAVAFYRDALGLPLLMEVPGMAFFDCAGTRLMLGIPESDEYDHPSSILYFRCDDIAATHEALAGRGVVFRREPGLVAKMPDHELWLAFFLDSEGNTMALMSEVR
jgi:predicted enzyme related to lactoylglutathione lyase